MDVNPIIRDVDLDTLEKVVSVIAFGDIEAEDTRHLTELNFVKVFRLAQLTVEYLLYVQDCLQSTNSWLLQDRAGIEKYLQAARLRVRELDSHLKMTKKELRRSRKTAKTYEAMTTLNKGGMIVDGGPDVTGGTGTGVGATSKVATMPAPAMNAAVEALLKRELAFMSGRLERAQAEAQQMRMEREEVYSQLREIELALAASGGTMGRGFPSLGSPPLSPSSILLGGRTQYEQLSKVQAELRLSKMEKDELQSQLEKATSEKRELQKQKSTLLKELLPTSSSTPSGPDGRPASPPSNSLSTMLFDAEKEKRRLEDALLESQEEVGTLRRELMKAMKEAAKGGIGGGGGGGGAEDLQRQLQAMEASNRELALRSSELERELGEKRRAMQDLEDELDLTRQQAAQAQQKLFQAKQASSVSPQAGEGGARTSEGGFVKIPPGTDGGGLAAKRLAAELEATKSANAKLQEELKYKDSECRSLESSLVQSEDKLAQMRAAWADLKSRLPADALRGTGPSAISGTVKEKVEAFEKLAESSLSGMALPQLPPAPGGQGYAMPPPPSAVASLLAKETGPIDAGSFRFNSPSSAPNPSTPSPPTPQVAAQSAHARAAVAASMPTGLNRRSYRPSRPTEPEMRLIKQRVMDRVGGQSPAQLHLMVEDELRVISENPYEYEGDDEIRFRSLLPHEIPGREGVKSVLGGHTAADVNQAHAMFLGEALSQVDDALASFGFDPGHQEMTDREYAAAMMELDSRRESRYSSINGGDAARETDTFLRDALMTHLELIRREAVSTRGKVAVLEEGAAKEKSWKQASPLPTSSATATFQPSPAPASVPSRSPAPDNNSLISESAMVASLPAPKGFFGGGAPSTYPAASSSRQAPPPVVSIVRPSAALRSIADDFEEEEEEEEDVNNATFSANLGANKPSSASPPGPSALSSISRFSQQLPASSNFPAATSASQTAAGTYQGGGISDTLLGASLPLSSVAINPLDQSLKKQGAAAIAAAANAGGGGGGATSSRASLNQSLGRVSTGPASLNHSFSKQQSVGASSPVRGGGGVAAAAALLRPAAVQQLVAEAAGGANPGSMNNSIRSTGMSSPSRRKYPTPAFDDDSDEEDEDGGGYGGDARRSGAASRANEEEDEDDMEAIDDSKVGGGSSNAALRMLAGGGGGSSKGRQQVAGGGGSGGGEIQGSQPEVMTFDEDDGDELDLGDLSGGWKTGDAIMMPKIVAAAQLANAALVAEERERAAAAAAAGGGSFPPSSAPPSLAPSAWTGSRGGASWTKAPVEPPPPQPFLPLANLRHKAEEEEVTEDVLHSFNADSPRGGADRGELQLPPPRGGQGGWGGNGGSGGGGAWGGAQPVEKAPARPPPTEKQHVEIWTAGDDEDDDTFDVDDVEDFTAPGAHERGSSSQRPSGNKDRRAGRGGQRDDSPAGGSADSVEEIDWRH